MATILFYKKITNFYCLKWSKQLSQLNGFHLSFHLFLSFSGLTTIDFMERWMPEEGDDRSRWYTVVSSQELKFSNFKERIGASGSWWCLRCLLPPLPLGWLPRNIHKAKTRGPTIIDPFFGSKF